VWFERSLITTTEAGRLRRVFFEALIDAASISQLVKQARDDACRIELHQDSAKWGSFKFSYLLSRQLSAR
jgi:hypothetical protein